MNEVVKSIIEFFILFVVIFIIYKQIYKRKKDFSSLKESDEVRVFVLKYDIDVRKIDYNKLLNVLALINSFIISFTATVIVRVKGIVWTILTCMAIVMVLLIALYTIAGNYFKSKEKNITVESKIEEVVKETKKKKTTKKKEGKK
jgi:uncharacterized membrane protein